MASPSAETTYEYGPSPCYNSDPHAPLQVLPMQYQFRLFVHFVRINHWKPHMPCLAAPYVPLQPHRGFVGVIHDGNEAGDMATYQYETLVDTPEYPCRPYCCRHFFTDLRQQSQGGLDLAEVLRFATTAPWSLQPDLPGINAKIFYYKSTEEFGAPIDLEQALPCCDHGGRGLAPQVDLEVFLSPEWRLWQLLPLCFSYHTSTMPEDGSDTRRRRDLAGERYCLEVVENSYYGW